MTTFVYISKKILTSSYIVSCYNRLANHLINCREYYLSEYDVDFRVYEDNVKVLSGDKCFYLCHGTSCVTPSIKASMLIACFWDDLHYFSEEVKRHRLKMFSNSDILLLTYFEHFIDNAEYADFHHKAYDFPWFSAFDFEMPNKFEWSGRRSELILSGRMTEPYVLRRLIKDRYAASKNVWVHPHPGYNERQKKDAVLGLEYYNLLERFKGGLVTSANLPGFAIDYPVAKYFEIPSVGSLLIAESIPSISKLGFLNGENCILMNSENFENIIERIVSNFDLYYDVACEGKKLIESKHSILVRASQLCKLFSGAN